MFPIFFCYAVFYELQMSVCTGCCEHTTVYICASVSVCVCVYVWPAGPCWYSILPPVTLQLCENVPTLLNVYVQGGTWRVPHLREIHKRQLFLASSECPLFPTHTHTHTPLVELGSVYSSSY